MARSDETHYLYTSGDPTEVHYLKLLLEYYTDVNVRNVVGPFLAVHDLPFIESEGGKLAIGMEYVEKYLADHSSLKPYSPPS